MSEFLALSISADVLGIWTLPFLQSSVIFIKSSQASFFPSPSNNIRKYFHKEMFRIPEMGTRHFFIFATTTTRQRNKASVTKKSTTILRSRCLNGIYVHNEYRPINSFNSLKIWSRCRSSVVACPALQDTHCLYCRHGAMKYWILKWPLPTVCGHSRRPKVFLFPWLLGI